MAAHYLKFSIFHLDKCISGVKEDNETIAAAEVKATLQ